MTENKVKTKTILTSAKELEVYRFNETFYTEVIKKHSELVALAFALGVHPDSVFKALFEYDLSCKKDVGRE